MTAGRTCGSRIAQALGATALGVAGGTGAAAGLAEGRRLFDDCGLRWPLERHAPPAPERRRDEPVAAPRASVRVRCLGGFQMEVDGRQIDCALVKPRARLALRLLALHAPQPVHREMLIGWLWPGLDTAAGTRNLHVVVSALRSLLEPVDGKGRRLLVREGETYRLALPDDADVDTRTFDDALLEARPARITHPERAIDALGRALDAYLGELLPEDGPAEWVVKERDRYRMNAADAAQGLAELQLERGSHAAAARSCERGLHIDRYRDPLWRLLIDVHDRAGDHAASARTRKEYERILEELGLST